MESQVQALESQLPNLQMQSLFKKKKYVFTHSYFIYNQKTHSHQICCGYPTLHAILDWQTRVTFNMNHGKYFTL